MKTTTFPNHLKSWIVTFLGIFLPMVAPAVGGLSLTHAGLLAFGLACCRSAVKVLGELLGMTPTA